MSSFQSFPLVVRFDLYILGFFLLLSVYENRYWNPIFVSIMSFNWLEQNIHNRDRREKMNTHEPHNNAFSANLHLMRAFLQWSWIGNISKNSHINTWAMHHTLGKYYSLKALSSEQKMHLRIWKCARILLCMHQRYIKNDAFAQFKTIKANLIRMLIM